MESSLKLKINNLKGDEWERKDTHKQEKQILRPYMDLSCCECYF